MGFIPVLYFAIKMTWLVFTSPWKTYGLENFHIMSMDTVTNPYATTWKTALNSSQPDPSEWLLSPHLGPGSVFPRRQGHSSECSSQALLSSRSLHSGGFPLAKAPVRPQESMMVTSQYGAHQAALCLDPRGKALPHKPAFRATCWAGGVRVSYVQLIHGRL